MWNISAKKTTSLTERFSTSNKKEGKKDSYFVGGGEAEE
jgi:hypothetical protein